jgi:hypothetical protein
MVYYVLIIFFNVKTRTISTTLEKAEQFSRLFRGPIVTFLKRIIFKEKQPDYDVIVWSN